jgi:hypothetical protein
MGDEIDLVARTIWENVAHLTSDYSAVSFDQIKVRPRYTGLHGTLRHAAERVIAVTAYGQSAEPEVK